MVNRKPQVDHHGDKVNRSKYDDIGETQTDTDSCTWGDLSPGAVWLLVAATNAAGDCVMFTSTRQGGIGLTLMSGDARVKLYSNDVDNMETKVKRATDAALASLPAQVKSKLLETHSRWV